ncbi:hypothetical protein HDV05_007591 [Chytridiales sp. JEL 0842]|nr:hypothetical protein HDV05_007591 [Chytridiales sp. JEL 0842]
MSVNPNPYPTLQTNPQRLSQIIKSDDILYKSETVYNPYMPPPSQHQGAYTDPQPVLPPMTPTYPTLSSVATGYGPEPAQIPNVYPSMPSRAGSNQFSTPMYSSAHTNPVVLDPKTNPYNTPPVAVDQLPNENAAGKDPILAYCCGCVDLRVGTMILAGIGLIIDFVAMCVAFSWFTFSRWAPFVLHGLLSLAWVFLHGYGFYGAYRNNVDTARNYAIVIIIRLVLNFIFRIATFYFSALSIIAYLMTTAVETYFAVCIWSYWIDLRNNPYKYTGQLDTRINPPIFYRNPPSQGASTNPSPQFEEVQTHAYPPLPAVPSAYAAPGMPKPQ